MPKEILNRVSILFPSGSCMLAMLTDEEVELFKKIITEEKLSSYIAYKKMKEQITNNYPAEEIS